MPVEQKAEAMERIASQSQEVEWLGSGYGGGAAWRVPCGGRREDTSYSATSAVTRG